MNITEAELPDDIMQLKLMVIDLNRRLQNTQYILQSEKQIKDQLFQQNEYYKYQIKILLQSFALEFSRVKQIELKHLQEKELESYEKNKTRNTKSLENLRIMELDHQMTGRQKFVPKNLMKLRNQVIDLEKQQENQKKFLNYLTSFQNVNEQLIHGIQQNKIQDVLNCLQQGADINYIDGIGYLPVHYAAIYGFHDICQLLLMKGADFSTYLTGYSPLVFACQYGHVSILSLLISYGGNMNDKDKNGVSPIMMAVMNYQFHIMEYCIMNGANILDYDLSTENNLLHLIVLISSPNYYNKYLAANNVPMISDPSSSPSAQGGRANGILNRFNTSNHNSSQVPIVNEVILSQIIHFLIQNGCDIYQINKESRNPYQLALILKNRQCIDILKPFYEPNNTIRATGLPTMVGEPSVSGGNSLVDKASQPSKLSQSQQSNPKKSTGPTKDLKTEKSSNTLAVSANIKPVTRTSSSSKLAPPAASSAASKGMSTSQSHKILPSNPKSSNNEIPKDLQSDPGSLERPSTLEITSSIENLAIPPPLSQDSFRDQQKPFSSKNLLEKINEHWTFQEGSPAVPKSNQGNNKQASTAADLQSVASSVTFD